MSWTTLGPKFGITDDKYYRYRVYIACLLWIADVANVFHEPVCSKAGAGQHQEHLEFTQLAS